MKFLTMGQKELSRISSSRVYYCDVEVWMLPHHVFVAKFSVALGFTACYGVGSK